jgi:hypothetical protein
LLHGTSFRSPPSPHFLCSLGNNYELVILHVINMIATSSYNIIIIIIVVVVVVVASRAICCKCHNARPTRERFNSLYFTATTEPIPGCWKLTERAGSSSMECELIKVKCLLQFCGLVKPLTIFQQKRQPNPGLFGLMGTHTYGDPSLHTLLSRKKNLFCGNHGIFIIAA